MSTRLHALGFPPAWTADVAFQLRGLVEQSRIVETQKGTYRHWRSRDGAELWFHYPTRQPRAPGSDASRIDIITPFHRGLSAIKLRIGRVLAMDRANPLEGSCLAWLPKTASGWREQAIVFELVPYARHAFGPQPFKTEAQIVCFAHGLWAFDTTDRYISGTPQNRRIKVGAYVPVAQSDVPEVALTYRNPPVTLGLLTGHVRRAIRFINPVTREPYYWLSLDTQRGLFDVVVNPAVVVGDVSEGNVVQACGSFVARLAKTTF